MNNGLSLSQTRDLMCAAGQVKKKNVRDYFGEVRASADEKLCSAENRWHSRRHTGTLSSGYYFHD